MSKKTVQVVTQSVFFPAGTVAGGVKVTVTGPTAVDPQVLVSPYTADYDLGAGDYVVDAQAVDANGAALGDPVSASFTVAPDVAVDVPVSISLA